MQIHFQIEYFTSWGEDLVIFISHKDGSVKELQMANDGHGNWYLDFATDNSSSLNDASYKYAVKSQGNIIRYEEGAQHTIPAIESEYIVLADRWSLQIFSILVTEGVMTSPSISWIYLV